MSETRNLLLAVVASVVIMVGWRFTYERLFPTEYQPQKLQKIEEESSIPEVDDIVGYKTRADALKASERFFLGNTSIAASISLRGALIDDVSLTKYHVTPDKHSGNVVLMSPTGTAEDSIVEFGWVDPRHVIKVPNKDTQWEPEGDVHNKRDGAVTLRWDNGEGLIFRLRFSLDKNYMLQVSQDVENNTDSEINLAYYGRINKLHHSNGKSYWISHEGAIGSFGGSLEEWTYKDLKKAESVRVSAINQESGRDWIGLADKYWFTALVPEYGNNKLAFRAQYVHRGGNERFQVDYSRSHGIIAPHGSVTSTTHLFIGAKELDLLDMYKTELNIPLFDKAVDFGVLYLITKPVFLLLQYFNRMLGNFGLAIIMLTVSIKLIVFPLSTKSYVSMFKLRKLQPEVTRIKELYKSDDLRISKEIASLFKKHAVSPMSGVLPLLVQVPVFFALYKVLFVTIEMRHAPLFAWIKDLSTQDTANFLNLCGILPFQPPICIGVLPVILGFTMVLQQKLSQQESQDSYGIMKFLPYIFVFIFSSFPAGLVLYWICSNVITIVQQLLVRRYVFSKEGLVDSSA